MHINQIALVSAITKELERQHRKIEVNERQMNALIQAANDIVAAFKQNHVESRACSGLTAWRHSDDTGMSSRAIANKLEHGYCDGSHPIDPSDFGRCYRLLEAVPEFRPRIGEMKVVSDVWARLASSWDEMDALYRAELPSGRAPKLYDLMQKLIDGTKS